MKEIVRNIGIIALIVGLWGCRKTAPQRPTRLHESPQTDTTLVGMMTLNERMAGAADRTVLNHIRALCEAEGTTPEESWVRMDCGAWMRRVAADENDCRRAVEKEEKWLVQIIIRDLEGKTLADREMEAIIGKQELPPAVEEALGEMHEGEKREVISPWYAAYGPIGDSAIEGYENIQIEICAKQKI